MKNNILGLLASLNQCRCCITTVTLRKQNKTKHNDLIRSYNKSIKIRIIMIIKYGQLPLAIDHTYLALLHIVAPTWNILFILIYIKNHLLSFIIIPYVNSMTKICNCKLHCILRSKDWKFLTDTVKNSNFTWNKICYFSKDLQSSKINMKNSKMLFSFN